jgi:hypothetical protein
MVFGPARLKLLWETRLKMHPWSGVGENETKIVQVGTKDSRRRNRINALMAIASNP